MAEWRVDGRVSAAGELVIELEGGHGLLDGSPVDMLLGAIAGCFLRSCHLVQKARREEASEISVKITGRKADGIPNRVAHVEIAYAMPGLDPALGERIARDAKRICTVTNSMSCEFEVRAN